MQPQLRDFFDQHLEQVLAELPAQARKLLDEVPLIVEDHPSAEMMRKVGVRRRSHLCGLYTGIPLTERRVWQSGVPSDVIYVFREGVLAMARQRSGVIDERQLRHQIRLTILHELGHHHGFDEEQLRRLGY